MSKTAVYTSWMNMRQRCGNPADPSYAAYGGRGIRVCDQWQNSFESFIADVGLPAGQRVEIDRVDVNGNYEPANCRWATMTEQARNRRNTVHLTLDGQIASLTEWSERTGINQWTLRQRLKLGWSDERALTELVSPTAGRFHRAS